MLKGMYSFDYVSDLSIIFTGGTTIPVSSVIQVVGYNPSSGTPGGRTGPNCLQLSGGGDTVCGSSMFPTPMSKATFGFAFYCPSLSTPCSMAFLSNNPGVQGPVSQPLIGLFLYPGGAVGIDYYPWAGHYYSPTVLSASALWRYNSWNYIELQTTIGSSVTVTVHLNGVAVLTHTCDTSGGVSSVTWQCFNFANQGGTVFVDDAYVLDGTDASGGNPSANKNNDFLGDCKVIARFPISDGPNTDWTPLSGSSHYAMVNKYAYSDSDYVYSSTAGNKDTYGFTGLVTSGVIYGVQVNLIARKDDAGSRVLEPICNIGGTIYSVPPSLGLPSSYIGVQSTLDNNPATTNAFGDSDLNASYFGMQETV